jgi:hypothetical protein
VHPFLWTDSASGSPPREIRSGQASDPSWELCLEDKGRRHGACGSDGIDERRQKDLAIWGMDHRRALPEVIDGGLSALALARLVVIFRPSFAEEGAVMR